MRKFWMTVYKILPHITIATALMLAVLVTVDFFNRAMSFLDNKITKGVFIAFLVLVILQSVLAIAFNYNLNDRKDASDAPRHERKRNE